MAPAQEEAEGPHEEERQFIELRPQPRAAPSAARTAPAPVAGRSGRGRRGLAVGLAAAVLILLVTAAQVLRGGVEDRREAPSVETHVLSPPASAPVEAPVPPQAPPPAPAAEPEPPPTLVPPPAPKPVAPKPVARPVARAPAATAPVARARVPARAAPPAAAVETRAAAPRPEPAAAEPAPSVAQPPPRAKEPEPPAVAAVPASSVPSRRLAPASVERAIARKKVSFDQCVDQALAAPGGEALAGRKIALLIAVESGGLVEAAQVEQPEIEGSALGACLRRAAGGLLFPPFEGEPVGVRIPLQLGASAGGVPR